MISRLFCLYLQHLAKLYKKEFCNEVFAMSKRCTRQLLQVSRLWCNLLRKVCRKTMFGLSQLRWTNTVSFVII